MKEPSFDNWTIIFLLFSFLGFITSILIQFQNGQNRIGKFLISLLLVLFSLTLVDYVLYWTRYQIYFPHFAGLSGFFFLLFGPIVFLYVESVQKHSINSRSLLHFIPFCTAMLIHIPYLIQAANQKKFNMVYGVPKESFYFIFFQIITWFSIIQIFSYGILIYNMRKAFSEFILIKNWIIMLCIGLCGIAFSFLIYKLFVAFGILTLEWDYMIAFSMVVFILIITVVAFLKPYVFDDLMPKIREKKYESDFSTQSNAPRDEKATIGSFTKYKNSPIDWKTSKELAEKLDRLMTENTLWRKNDLRLNDLAIKMELQKEYISQIINEQFKMNFFEFVNRYRIEEGKALIKNSDKEVTLIEIAYIVGFNNKVSFGKAFRAYVNMSPIEYKKSFKKSEAPHKTSPAS
ncbi:helix-turn-helix domain-containing protein [Flavobacterium wongokense]|uniref:helix-turn-helix domain-containing protein n=1 Tax=Flavobacterium wongokense TaxID=2910674 RepID=UPI001F20416D|nr:AraC family transcriptional regulator [Flavobacterium sp. WG47]MCF6133381.1 AraC family transcriptional regulator [Flavobacterium sp. WG47]